MTTYTVHYPAGGKFQTTEAATAEQWSKAGCEVTAVTH